MILHTRKCHNEKFGSFEISNQVFPHSKNTHTRTHAAQNQTQASSSLDPTFWVTHPTMERLWMFKRLTGTMTDLSWPDADVAYVDDTTGETVVESLSLYSEDCLGHRGKFLVFCFFSSVLRWVQESGLQSCVITKTQDGVYSAKPMMVGGDDDDDDGRWSYSPRYP